jgi:hypothetical protein
LFEVVGRLEEFGAFLDFDMAGAATRGPARERNGGEVVVTDVQKLSTVGSLHTLGYPNPIREKHDIWHVRQI